MRASKGADRLEAEPAPDDEGRVDVKSAALLARRIESDIAARGWPVGELVGSEADLLTRYEVSRSVFRQAVRLLEQRSVAQSRRGVGGGLVITRPTIRSVASIASTYLDYRQVADTTLSDLAGTLDVMAARLAAERIDDAGREALLAIVEHEAMPSSERQGPHPAATMESNLHLALARVADDPGLELFLGIIFQHSKGPRRGRRALPTARVHDDHVAIVEAVCTGDVELAESLMRRHTTLVRERSASNDTTSTSEAGTTKENSDGS